MRPDDDYVCKKFDKKCRVKKITWPPNAGLPPDVVRARLRPDEQCDLKKKKIRMMSIESNFINARKH
jgi:hypothetical protein